MGDLGLFNQLASSRVAEENIKAASFKGGD